MSSIKQNNKQNFERKKMEKNQNEQCTTQNSYDIFNPFQKSTEILEPKNHKYFKRNYSFESQTFNGHFILDDFRQYSEFLNIEQNKLICLLENHYHSNIFKPICKILRYHQELLKQTQEIISKFIQRSVKPKSQKNELEEKISVQSSKNQICFKCNEDVMKIQFNKLKQQLGLYSFWDKYKFYKYDANSMQGMRQFKQQYSGQEIQSYDPNHQFRDTSIGLQQFQEILNHLNSDLLIKNQAFQNGVIHMTGICNKVDEDIFIQKMESKDIKYYDSLVNNDEINNKMKAIIVKFLDNYKKLKIKNKRDCEVQVSIKEYEGMKKLQKQKKELRLILNKQISQREKQKDQAQTNIATLNVEVSLLNQKCLKIKSASQDKFKQYEKKILELNKIIQMLKNQVEQENQKYAKLQIQTSIMLRSKRQIKNPKRQGKKNTRFQQSQNQITSKKQLRTRNNLTNEQKGHTSNESKKLQSDGIIKSQQKLYQTLSKHKKNRKPSIMERQMQGQSSFTDLSKLGYQKIQEKNQESQPQILTKKRKLSKSSRFRVLAGLNQPQTKRGIQTNNSIPENDQFTKSKYKINYSGERQKTETQNNFSSHDLIEKLYMHQVNKQSLKQISFQQFATSYQLFINQITSKLKNQNIESKKHILKQNRDHRSSKKLSQFRTKSFKQFEQQSNNKDKSYDKSVKNKQNKKKSLKLQPLSKKSQYYLNKSKKFLSQHQTPSMHSLSYQGIDQHYQIKVFEQNDKKIQQQNKHIQQIQQIKNFQIKNDRKAHIEQSTIIDLFGGYQNIQNYKENIKKHQKLVIDPLENQFIMNTMTLFVQLHIHDSKSYEYLKNIILNPYCHVKSNSVSQNKQYPESSLRVGLKYIVLVHRNCRSMNKNKQNQMCEHLLNLKDIILKLFDSPSKQTNISPSVNIQHKNQGKKELKKKKLILVSKK